MLQKLERALRNGKWESMENKCLRKGMTRMKVRERMIERRWEGSWGREAMRMSGRQKLILL